MTEENICPACGKPTAGYVPCPHCGADTRIKLNKKVVPILILIVFVVGIAFFGAHLATIRADTMSISSIDSWQNYASVWVSGIVTSGPQMDERGISFDIQDSSGGTMEIEIYVPPTTLKSQGLMPSVGDNVKAFGLLRVYVDGSITMRPSKLGEDKFTKENKFQLYRAEPVETNITNLLLNWHSSNSLRFKRVSLEGTIVGMRALSSAKIYTLRDSDNSTVDMYVHNGVVNAENGELDLKLLQTVRATVGASQYGNSPQLVLSSYDQIEVLESGAATPVPIESVDESMRGEFITTGGKIIFVLMSGETSSLEVEKYYLVIDNESNATTWMWNSVYQLLPDSTRELLKRGSDLQFTGKVSQSGELSIEFLLPPDYTIDNGTFEPDLIENVMSLEGENVGKVVAIEGTVTSVENVAAFDNKLPPNRLFTIQDNFGGNVKLLVTNTVYERILSPPVVGDKVNVVGTYFLLESNAVWITPGLPSDIVRVS